MRSILGQALIALLLSDVTRAQELDVFRPANGFWLAPKIAAEPLYGAQTTAANWRISQWNSPAPNLPPFANGRTRNDALQVVVAGTPGRLAYTITQRGQGIECVLAGAPWEFDAFASPNTDVGQGNSAIALAGGLQTLKLASLHRLTHRISVRPLRFRSMARSCAHNKAVLMTAIILSNREHRQTFFYQLHLANFNDPPKHPFWWATGKNGRYGFGDLLSSYNHSEARIGRTTTYELALADRIKELIVSGQSGIATDLSQWFVSGTYHGQALWGQVVVASQWSGFGLSYDR